MAATQSINYTPAEVFVFIDSLKTGWKRCLTMESQTKAIMPISGSETRN